MDRSSEATGRRPMMSRRWLMIASFGAIAVAAIAAMALWRNRERTAEPVTNPAAQPSPGAAVEGKASTPGGADIASLSSREQLALAFRTAFGTDRRAALTIRGSRVTFEPERLLWLGDQAVLISAGSNESDCHACAGTLGVHYLRAAGDRFELTGSWPAAVEGWGYGAPPQQWSISHRFTRHPAILAEGHFMGQGIVCRSATLTVLGPDGPARSDRIWTGYSNEGATDEAERIEDLNGAIVDVRRDRSFQVRFTGTDRFTERYVRRGNRFVAAAQTRIPCV